MNFSKRYTKAWRKFRNRKSTYLSGEAFESICDFTYKPSKKIPCTARVVFCKIDHASAFFTEAKTQHRDLILVTHNGDLSVRWALEKWKGELPPQVKHWFAQNTDVNDPRITPIPIGLANSAYSHGDARRVERVAREEIPKTQLAFLCAKISTNPQYRSEVYKVCQDKAFITIKGGDTTIDEIEFLRDLASSKFTLAPKGNGWDSHRIWEALYLGCYPVVEAHMSLRQFQDLPILYVKSYSDLTEVKLSRVYEGFKLGTGTASC